MNHARQLETQWIAANDAAATALWKNGDYETIDAVASSLRSTWRLLKIGSDPRALATSDFVLEVDEAGEHIVKRNCRAVPICGSYAKHVFAEAGVRLLPAQAVLLHPAVVKDLVEEALGRIAFDEALLRKEREELCRNLRNTGSAAVAEALGAAEFQESLVRRTKIDLIAASLAADDLAERAAA